MNQTSYQSQLTVILPTLNERENIGNMISQLLSVIPDLTIIVADDGSTDGPIEIINEEIRKNPNIVLLDRSESPVKGLSISIKDAIFNTKTLFFVVLDSDFQHPPEKIKDAAALLSEGSHIVVGHRIEITGWSLKRRFISWGATTLGKFTLAIRRKKRPQDIMSGFFGGETDFIQKVIVDNPNSIKPKGYKILFDLLKVLPKDVQIGEFPYTFQERGEGTSKMKLKHIWIYFKSLFN